MKVKKTTIPSDSLTRQYLPADYVDVFACEVEPESKTAPTRELTPDDVMTAFWTGGPAWVGVLFRLRNFLVRFVGLQGSKKNDPKEFEKFIRGAVGSARSFMSIAAKNGRETVMLLADKHLDAYMSVCIESAAGAENAGTATRKTVSIITLVHFKNTLGRVYFFVIRPFHGLIVKSMLRRAVEKIIRNPGM